MKLYVPAVGDKITLSEAWKFTLYHESRNSSLLKFYVENENEINREKFLDKNHKYLVKYDATIPAGTELTIDRVYVRNKASTPTGHDDDYDSLTFTCNLVDPKGSPEKIGKFGKSSNRRRFWAKLNDVNNIVYSSVTPASQQKPKKFTQIRLNRNVLSAFEHLENANFVFSPNLPFTKEAIENIQKILSEYEEAQKLYNIAQTVEIEKQRRLRIEQEFNYMMDQKSKGNCLHFLACAPDIAKINTLEGYTNYYDDMFPGAYRHHRVVDGIANLVACYLYFFEPPFKDGIIRTINEDKTVTVRMSNSKNADEIRCNYIAKVFSRTHDLFIDVTLNKEENEILAIDMGFVK